MPPSGQAMTASTSASRIGRPPPHPPPPQLCRLPPRQRRCPMASGCRSSTGRVEYASKDACRSRSLTPSTASSSHLTAMSRLSDRCRGNRRQCSGWSITAARSPGRSINPSTSSRSAAMNSPTPAAAQAKLSACGSRRAAASSSSKPTSTIPRRRRRPTPSPQPHRRRRRRTHRLLATCRKPTYLLSTGIVPEQSRIGAG